MSEIQEIKSILRGSLQLGDRAGELTESTQLLGSLPELDSMAVVTVITALEDFYGFIVEDDEISAETFETVGSLSDFVKEKLKS